MLLSFLVGLGLILSVKANTPHQDDAQNDTPDHLDRSRRLFVKKSTGRPWPKAIMPYEIQEAAMNGKAEYERIIALYEARSCVRMPYWNSSIPQIYGLKHKGRMRLIKSGGCYSTHKGVTNGPISVSCCGGHECIHEMGHTLGFSHEMTNPLRDGWLRSNYHDIWPSDISTYKKSTWTGLDQTQPYDISTIMHYRPWMFGVRGGSMTVLFPELHITWEYFYYFMEVAYGYNCEKFPQCHGKILNCQNDGYQTIINGKCACDCPTGLDPDNGCKTPLRKVTSSSWPKGQYALPKPKTGCPTGGSFQDGQLKQIGADGNTASNPTHMEGDMKRTQAELNFCTRTISDDVFTTEDAAKFNWPIGKYCIYMKGDKCPTAFSKGSVEYNMTSVTSTGQLPEGVYGQTSVKMSFCCSYRGFLVDPVSFPTEKPFALIRLGSSCQQVTGMRAQTESFTLRSFENFKVDDATKGWLGHGGKSLTVPLCYYRPADMDCGGSITLSESNPVATIEMSGKGRTDLECTWVVKAENNETTLVFDFEEFNIKKEGKNCDDRVEVRHARIGQYGLKYCGEKIDHSIRSITDKLLVRFFTSGNSDASFKARIKLTDFDDMCYDAVGKRGLSYDGSVNYTRNFEPCLPWAEMTGCYHHPLLDKDVFDSLDGNACRNPDNSFRPWCYTAKYNCRRNYCDVCGIETPYDKLDYCDSLKENGFCTTDAAMAVKYCAKTCFDEIPGNTILKKKFSEVTCGQPTAPHDGVLGQSKSSYNLGDTVQYKCNRGPSIVTSRCMTSGQWSELGSACLQCPVGATLLENTCYISMQEGKPATLQDGMAMCKSVSGIIATPMNEKEASIINTVGHARNSWIKINDIKSEGTWVYDDGTKITWSNWAKVEPNSYGGNEDCVAMQPSTKWMDVPCTSTYGVVCAVPAIDVTCEDILGSKCQQILADRPNLCEDLPELANKYCGRTCGVCSTETSKCSVQNSNTNVLTLTTESEISVGESVTYRCERFTYPVKGDKHQACLPGGKLSGEPLQCGECPIGFEFVNNACHGLLVGNSLSIGDAQKKCEEVDGFVAMPKSQKENDAINSLALGQKIWLSATDGKKEGDFLWGDGSSVTWSHWMDGEPKAEGGSEDCSIMNADKTWTNVKCGDYKLATVCSLPKSGGKVCYDRTTRGVNYIGRANVTIKNKPCINWSSNCNKSPFKRDYERYNLEFNYCRNPDNSPNGPWCYTEGCSWDYCDVCDRSSQPDYDIRDKGKSYTGNVNIAVDGHECLRWADQKACNVNPAKEKYAGLNFEKNYCRNYDNSPGPWCYTTGCEWAVCDMSTADPLITTNIVDVRCEAPPAPIDGEMVSVPRSSYRLGDEVTWKCKKNKFVVTTTCLTSGGWSPVGSACTECPVGYYPFENTCYGFVDKQIDYDKSIKECSKIGGHLPRPKSLKENDFIKSLNHGKYTWIDARRYADDNYATFKWSDGTAVNWLNGKQDGMGCAFINEKGIWKATRCDFLAPLQNLICAVTKLEVTECLDFLEDQCEQLMKEKPSMCQDYPEFGQKFCSKSCGHCGDVKCQVAPTDRFSKVSTSDKEISAGQYVTYSCKAGTFRRGGDSDRACLGIGLLAGQGIECDACPEGYTENNGFCYKLINTPYKFSQAVAECSKMNGYVASPRNKAQNDFIDSIRKGSDIWIGASDAILEGDFRWQDGTKLQWMNWEHGEPNNFGGVEDCVQMGDKTWFDQPCELKSYDVVCEIPVLGVETCYDPEDKGATYAGKVSVTEDSKSCIPWATATKCPHNPFTPGDERKNLIENYCRNPDNSPGPWCYIDADTCDKKYCSVCDHEKGTDLTATTTCGAPIPPSDGVLLDDVKVQYNLGDVANFVCKGTEWTIPVTSTCLTHGQWSPVGIACTECPGGYEVFQNECYHFEEKALTFAGAQDYCQREAGGYIATPKTSKINDFVSSISHRHPIWIGLNDIEKEGAWLWDDGTKITWSNWEPGEPNNWAGNEDAGLLKSNKQWNDLATGGNHQFVCVTERQDPKTLLCEDFLQDQCSNLLSQDKDMCTHQVDFASQFCTKTCDLCSWKDVDCDIRPSNADTVVNPPTMRDTIKAGETVQYQCSSAALFRTGGDQRRTCMNSGQLSGSPLVCQDVLKARTVTVGPTTLTNGVKETPQRVAFFGDRQQYLIKNKGQIIAWNYYSVSAVQTAFQVWRRTGNGGTKVYQLVGQNLLMTPKEMGVHRLDVPAAARIEVQPDDMIGIVDGGKGGVKFTACDKSVHPEWWGDFYWSSKESSIERFKAGETRTFTAGVACVIFPLNAVVAVIE